MEYQLEVFLTLVLSILGILILFRRHRKQIFKLNESYLYIMDVKDRSIRREKQDGALVEVFQNQNASSKYISEYTISHAKKGTTLSCHGIEPLPKDELLLIEVYNKKRVAIETLRIKITNPALLEQPIVLPDETETISLSVYEVKTIDMKPIYQAFESRYKRVSWWLAFYSLFLYASLFYVLLYNLALERFDEMMNERTLALSGALLIVILLMSTLTVSSMLKKRLQRRLNHEL